MRKKGSGKQRIGEAKSREDLVDLESGQEDVVAEPDNTEDVASPIEEEKYEGPEGEEYEEDGTYTEKGDITKETKSDQEIINKNTNPGGEMEAPALIKERFKSDLPKPPESQDVEYLAYEEVALDDRVNTLSTALIKDPDAGPNHLGPWIEEQVGRNPETHRLMVVRIPAKEIKITPDQMMQYLGNVTMDHQAVHTSNVLVRHRREGYSFDRFYINNGKREPRCCYVPNHIHQAHLMFEKMVDRRTRKAFSRIKQIKGPMGKGTGTPMYRMLITNKVEKEGHYRELKRLFDRHFLRRGQEELADDVGLKVLIDGMT